MAGAYSAHTGLGSDDRFRLLFESASDAIVVGTPDGTITAVNPAACSLLGYSEEELLGSNGRALVAPEWREVVEAHAARKLGGAEHTSSYEVAFLDKSGKRVPVEIRSSVLREDGRVVAVQAVARDVRSRHRDEARLHELDAQFRGAFDHSPIGMAIASLDGRLLRTNAAFAKLVGRSAEDLLETTFRDLTPLPDQEREYELRERLFTRRVDHVRMETRYRRSDGSFVPVEVTLTVVRDQEGEPAFTVTQAVERGSRRDAESPLTPRERMVLALLAEGRTTDEAAEDLGIGSATVQTYVKRAMWKLCAKTRVHAVALAGERGWLHE
jgi:PAS domain S-box-containing protein